MIEAKTESGSTYIFDEGADKLTRVFRIGSGPMQQDGEWLVVYNGMPEIREGEQIFYTIEPFGDSEFPRYRFTSPVTRISLLPEREEENLPKCLK